MAGGGTGQKFAYTVTVAAGVASLLATFMSMISIWLQTKNYRKPLLQRYVVRILMMVPIYAISSWTSMISQVAAQVLDPIRDIYEAFTIYTFFHLLINYVGGERALIIMMHGREPVHHLWPLNHVLPRVDISDPYTFLAIKRGILQYAWLKPILAISAIIMKATGTYQEGYIGVTSGYFWSGILYNISVTVSLYSLGLFWVCMHHDLKPFRPVPKFLCVKLIIFASYWQGFFLSILVWLGALPDDVQGYTPDNLAAAIQDALICLEMPIFAFAHWYAFSWRDYADNNVLAARMPVRYAVRDAFGPRDLIQDTKETFSGDKYAYRAFDSGDKIMAHEESRSKVARINAGMRYERGGKGKYWIPRPGEINSEINPYTPLLGPNSGNNGESSRSRSDSEIDGEISLDPEEERLYGKARELEYGDWNYPVIPANQPARREAWTSRTSSPYQTVPGTASATEDYFGPSAETRQQPAEIVKPKDKKKKKGKQKQTEQGVPASAGKPHSPGGTKRPGFQVDDDQIPDISDVKLDVSKGGEEDGEEGSPSKGADNGGDESSHWDRPPRTPVDVSPRHEVPNQQHEDEENPWGQSSPVPKQPHL